LAVAPAAFGQREGEAVLGAGNAGEAQSAICPRRSDVVGPMPRRAADAARLTDIIR